LALAAGVKIEVRLNGHVKGGMPLDIEEHLNTGESALQPKAFGDYLQRQTAIASHLATNLSHIQYNSHYIAYSESGKKIASDDIIDGDVVYLVSAKTEFHWMWPKYKPGTTWEILDVDVPDKSKPIRVTALSDNPSVFRVANFMTAEEAEKLIHATTAGGYEPSTTGFNSDDIFYNETDRNSYQAQDDEGPLAMRIKRRAFDVLRLKFNERVAEGFSLLRYHPGEAYIPHTDWFDEEDDEKFNFWPDQGGTNRFVTFFLYLSDVEHGGWTVFPDTPPAPDQIKPGGPGGPRYTTREFRNSIGINNKTFLGSMIKECEVENNLKIWPDKGSAIFFYNQSPEGILDGATVHSACPVYKGVKYAANLWVWNQPDTTVKNKNAVEKRRKQVLKKRQQELEAGNVHYTDKTRRQEL